MPEAQEAKALCPYALLVVQLPRPNTLRGKPYAPNPIPKVMALEMHQILEPPAFDNISKVTQPIPLQHISAHLCISVISVRTTYGYRSYRCAPPMDIGHIGAHL